MKISKEDIYMSATLILAGAMANNSNLGNDDETGPSCFKDITSGELHYAVSLAIHLAEVLEDDFPEI